MTSNRYALLTALLAVVMSGCGGPSAAPPGAVTDPQSAQRDSALLTQDVGVHFKVQSMTLRPAAPDTTATWGELAVFAGVLPANPCGGLAVVNATLAVCGVIHNPAGETLTGGNITVLDQTFQFVFPPSPISPCTTFQVNATTSRLTALPNPGPPGIPNPGPPTVSFSFSAGELMSMPNPGPPNTNIPDPGPPDLPDPGPPNLNDSCTIQFGALEAGVQ